MKGDRPKPTPGPVDMSPGVACYSCGRSFHLGRDAAGSPMAFHASPHCAAFEALDTTEDAVEHSQKSRAAALLRVN